MEQLNLVGDPAKPGPYTLRRDLETLREFETQRVGPGFGGITYEIELLHSGCRQAALLRPFHFGRRQRHDARVSRLRHHGTERDDRSEEHTSELQSRVEIPYAVFC